MRRNFFLAVLAISALAAGGCGRRGPLEPPPGYAAAQRAVVISEAAKADADKDRPKYNPGILRNNDGSAQGATPASKPIPLDPKPFLLDPLIDE